MRLSSRYGTGADFVIYKMKEPFRTGSPRSTPNDFMRPIGAWKIPPRSVVFFSLH